MSHGRGRRAALGVACAAVLCMGAGASTSATGGSSPGSPVWLEAPASLPTGKDSLSRWVLPAWFDSARVQGLTRLPVARWAGRPAFRDAAARFLSLGFRVFTRHVKSSAWSPFVVGSGALPGAVRLGADSAAIRAAFAAAQRAGQHTIAYVWISSDSAMAARHPDWVCRGPNQRTPARGARGTPLDVTSAYRGVILGELEALARVGADGFFFDWTHLPPDGCWSPHLVKGFEARTGEPAPRRRNPGDPVYRAFLAYQASQVEATFAYWKEEIHRRYPGVVFVVSVATLPTFMDPRFGTDLAAVADAPKTEFLSPVRPAFGRWRAGADTVPRDVLLAAGWSLVRDAAAGRPPLVWASGFPDSVQAEGFVAAVLTDGCIASLDVADEIVAGRGTAPHATPVPALKAAAALGDRVSPALAGTRPLAWVGIHFPEAARNGLMGDPAQAYRRAVLPMLRAYETLTRARVPVRFVTDRQLADGDLGGLRALVLPDSSALTPAQEARVAAFRRGGGRVVGVGGLPASVAIPRPPVRVVGGPVTLHVGFFTDESGGRTTVLLTPDFSWVQPLMRRAVLRVEGREPGPVSGVVIRLPAGSPPPHAREWVTGRDLPVLRTPAGYEIHLPSFRILSAVTLTRR